MGASGAGGARPARLRRLARLARRVALRLAPETTLRALAPGTRWARLAPRGDELGLAGERLAARGLRREGWRVLGRRLATPHGEVDLWVARGRATAVVEVKTGRVLDVPRPRGAPPPELRWRPGQRLDRRRLDRLRRAARWLAERADDRSGGRVDLVEVLLRDPRERPLVLWHPGLARPLGRRPVRGRAIGAGARWNRRGGH